MMVGREKKTSAVVDSGEEGVGDSVAGVEEAVVYLLPWHPVSQLLQPDHTLSAQSL